MHALLRRLLTPLLLVAVALAAGCAGTPPPPDPTPERLFHDAAFAPPADAVRADAVFALNDGMRRFLDEDIARRARTIGPQRALIDALIRPGQLRIEYEATMTRNAAEAFDAHSGNCLSLVLMTAAFAKALDLRVDFNSAYLDETWSQRGNLLVRSGHVNVSFGRRQIDVGMVRMQPPVTIDFLPPDEVQGLRTRPITEQTVVAMYFNNRAAETLVQGDLDQAYAYAREAVRAEPGFLPAYNTLGLVYLRHGQAELAARAFEHVLARDDSQRQAMANLAETLDMLGRGAEASRWRQTLARLEPHPPFYFLALGRAAAQRQDWVEAKRQFERELARADYSSEVQFWMALASWHLGDLDAARKHLALAVDNSMTGGDRALYSAKLAQINAAQRH